MRSSSLNTAKKPNAFLYNTYNPMQSKSSPLIPEAPGEGEADPMAATREHAAARLTAAFPVSSPVAVWKCGKQEPEVWIPIK